MDPDAYPQNQFQRLTMEQKLSAVCLCCDEPLERPADSDQRICELTQCIIMPSESRYQVYGYPSKDVICQRCFAGLKADTFDLPSGEICSRHNYKLVTGNINRAQHALVACTLCASQFHTDCVLYHEDIWNGRYVCDHCRKKGKIKRPNNIFRARGLPVYEVDAAMEDRVNTMLDNLDAKKEAGHIYIRVIFNFRHRENTCPEEMTRGSSRPKCKKGIFAFQEINSHDLAFFGMYVTESEDDRRHTDLVYMDSVKYFRPARLRTRVYQEILRAYCASAGARGFRTASFIAATPEKGLDFIFNRHPPEQKTPSCKQLVAWYRDVLDGAMANGDIVTYRNGPILPLARCGYTLTKYKADVMDAKDDDMIEFDIDLVTSGGISNLPGNERGDCLPLLSNNHSFKMWCSDRGYRFATLQQACHATLHILAEVHRWNSRAAGTLTAEEGAKSRRKASNNK